MDATQELDQIVIRIERRTIIALTMLRHLWLLLGLAFFAGFFLGMGTARAEEGTASWYSTEACRVNPDPRCPTANGRSLYALERAGVLFAAKWGVPFGTRYRVCRADQRMVCTTVVVLDRGPARRLERTIDLSRAAFAALADPTRGTLRVTLDRLL